ncbi:MAG: DUF805 domain-containing protein [Alloprevotella sp.]|nr:DUF805 domain-containing protein [Alloprevotella sp.]
MPTKTLSFIEAIKACFAKFANFSGRARRSEFWWFYLLNAIPTGIISYMFQLKISYKEEIEAKVWDAAVNGGDLSALEAEAGSFDNMFFAVVGICAVVSLILLIPMLAAWVRRLHDVGKSGHLLWLILLCGVGGIIPLIMAIPDGKPEPNQYGPSPKYVAPEPTAPAQ